jgi:ubiquinone/menaquinone biosynthesis C-methylase UbiE
MNILDYIVDPYTKSKIKSDNKNLLKSKDNTYKLNTEIPVLIDENRINEHLRNQIKYFEDEMLDTFNNYTIEEWQKNYVNLFLDNFPDVKGKLILDCGSGSGYISIELAKRGALVISCDLTLMNLVKLKDTAQKLKIEKNIAFVCCSAEDLPFKHNIFDYFISNAVIEHLPKEAEAIQEIDRVIKKDGGLMVTVPLSYKYLNPVLVPLNYIYDQRIGHLRRYNKEILIKKFNKFDLKNTYYTGHTAKVVKVLANMLIKKELFSAINIEKEDSKNSNKKWFASNIIIFFNKSHR